MKVAIIGVGVMGETLLAGMLRSGIAPDDVTAAVRRKARADALAATHGVRTASAREAVVGADVIVLAVKPQDVRDVVAQVADVVTAEQVVVSVAAGVPTDLIEAQLPGVPVVRVMPNTPARVDEGMAAISAGRHATGEHLDVVAGLLEPTGKVVIVPEQYQDAVTAISGSGPAYLYFVVEAMIDAGVLLGLPRATATELVVQTMLGSATLLRDSGSHPTVLRENVTSPGGTTASALRVLEDHGVRAAFIGAMEAARDRSVALADAARTAEDPAAG